MCNLLPFHYQLAALRVDKGPLRCSHAPLNPNSRKSVKVFTKQVLRVNDCSFFCATKLHILHNSKSSVEKELGTLVGL